MKEIQRKVYLDRLISRRENGVIKIITGIRRCGKSYLLDPIFKNYLIQSGVREDHIIKLELDKEENKKYRDSHVLNEYIKSLIKDKEMYYILLDEIQLVEGFEAVLNTVNSYIKYIEDAFIINKSDRYDVKGKKYILTPQKYYFSDIGLRNARLNFRQQEENHIMENIIYNKLIIRGYNVDIF